MKREEAKKLATVHKGKSPVIHVSADGNVFFEPQKSDAEFHAKKAKIELFSFSESELDGKKEVSKNEKESEEAKAETAAEEEAEKKEGATNFEAKKYVELVEYCKEKQYPESEWAEIKSKKDIIAYMKTKI